MFPVCVGWLYKSVAFALPSVSVLRARGHFGNVTVFWRLFANDSITPLGEEEEFANVSGSITFATGEETKPIVLHAISDMVPEFNEFYVLKLVNISGKEGQYFVQL